jgi:hypothetical protein
MNRVAEAGAPRLQRVYRAEAIAKALGQHVQSVRERIERGASLRGWKPKDPGNTLGLWLVDANYADAHEPDIAAARLPSWQGLLPEPRSAPAIRLSAGARGVELPTSVVGREDNFGDSDGSEDLPETRLEVALRQASVEHNRRIIAERDAARALLEAKDVEIKLLRDQLEATHGQLRMARDGLRRHLEAYASTLHEPGPQ